MMPNNIFIVPSLKYKSNYLYFPYKGAFFQYDLSIENAIQEYLKEGVVANNIALKENIDKILAKPNLPISHPSTSFPGHIIFLLNEQCNLSCSYCYATSSHCQDRLTKEDIKLYIDYFFSYRSKNRTITFLGGGEPFLSWDLIEFTVQYSKSKANIYNEKIAFAIITNLTLLSVEHVRFICDNKISINVSFDILPEVQNEQRQFSNGNGSFFEVDKNIRKLISYGVFPRIGATITPYCVKLMPQMVDFVATHYPMAKSIHFEHVSSFEDLTDDLFLNEFVTYYYIALRKAKSLKMALTNSVTNSIRRIRKQFCSHEFCVTANNAIVSCHRVSNNSAPHFERFSYGRIENGEIKIEHSSGKIKEILPPYCENCFAKYNCAGGCRYNQMLLSDSKNESYCNFVRKMYAGLFDFLIE